MTELATKPHTLDQSDDVDLVEVLRGRRGWSDEYLAEIESEVHDELKSVSEMIETLEAIRQAGRKVTIAPDFDMDGIASGVLGYAGLAELGFDVELHLPDYRRGHDLRPEDIAEIQTAWPDTSVLLTCDGAVNSHEGIAAARSLGWTTLVTDHHQELEPGSSADITVNPCRLDETYAHRAICGAHVLHQVLTAYARRYRPDKLWEIHLLRLFAGIGTVSDVMPILHENRAVLRDAIAIARMLWAPAPRPYGPFSKPDPDLIDVEQATMLRLLAVEEHHPVYLRAFTGFAVALKAFAQAGKVRGVDDVDEQFFGFYLAPAMNAPRRTEEPLNKCFGVFTEDSVQNMLAAAQETIAGNERRKQLTELHMVEITQGEQPLAPWIYFSSAAKGMLGLLANRLMSEHGHPVVVVNHPSGPDEEVSGSGRAPAWLDIITTLEPHDGLAGVGHQQACGVRVATPALLDHLVNVLAEATQVAMLETHEDERIGDLVLGSTTDCDASLDHLDPLFTLARAVASLKPFGHGFTEPLVQLVIDPLGLQTRVIGSEEQHLRLTTRSGLTCLWWNSAAEQHDRLLDLARRAQTEAVPPLRLTARLEENTFRDVTRIQAMVVDEI